MHDVATSSNKAASGMQCQPANTAPLWHGKGHRAGAVEQIDAAAKHIAKIQSLILVPNRSLDHAIPSGNLLHTVSGREWLRGCSPQAAPYVNQVSSRGAVAAIRNRPEIVFGGCYLRRSTRAAMSGINVTL